MIIYKTTNIINDKIYIGQSRYNNEYYFGSGKLIIRSIKKYGKENFIKEIICKCKNQNELNELEKYWIKKLDSQNSKIGYNLDAGGKHIYSGNKISKSSKGHKKSEKTKEKMRIAASKRPPGYYKKFATAGGKTTGGWNRGIPMSNEQKIKLSVSHKGKIPWNKGKKLSNEEKIRIRNLKLENKNERF